MTIRQEYEEMKTELRAWNRRHNWDGTQFCYHIERISKKAQTIYRKLLEYDRRGIEVDRRIGVLTDEKYSQLMKVWEDCKTSMHRLYAQMYAHNVASMRLLEKSGFIKEGQLKDASWWNGRFRDVVIYGKIAEPTVSRC